MKNHFLALFIIVALFGFNAKKETRVLTADQIIFKDVNIVDVRSGAITPSHVIVKGREIEQILSLEEEIDFAEARVIEGKGNYLLPGLAEMHAHIPDKPWDDPLVQETLFLYLSNGITTIRGMLGNDVHLPLREKAANQEILSPRIYTSSPSLNGNTVTTPEEARKKVKDYAEAGYDFLKLHPGIRKHVFDTLVIASKEYGISYAGHVSNLVRIRHALENGYQTIDHIDGFVEGLVPEEAGVNPTENGFFGYNFTDLADSNTIPELVALSKKNKVWVVPTQSLFERWFSPIPAEKLVNQEEMQYMSPQTRENWVNSKNNLTKADNFDEVKWKQFNQLRYQLIKALQEDGQGLLLGSDAPQVFNVPGFSIHHEIQGMLAAGLRPLEILQTGTINPALFFDGNFGEIEEGMEADLILLKENPLDDLRHLKAPLGVMARGQWLDEKTIKEKLSEIAKKYE
ncbi:amidohydrolase family protein [uncultured Cyclobacterium sp.]|uniref:amidohydrolase family protein n=1 Tax=uncultured Cyclobacterium sp. TaxID=453820 RepID=UPI0030ED3E4C|tara:strand:+ start:96435 stop:97805 length:1371 start_codon:yes stop_codon:yes gene_type:complete